MAVVMFSCNWCSTFFAGEGKKKLEKSVLEQSSNLRIIYLYTKFILAVYAAF